MNKEQTKPEVREAQLGLWDAVSIIVGIVVGTSIFKTPGLIAQNVGGPWEMVAVWVLGGLLSLVGAFCYAELATTYPRSGGDYVYLTRAFGSWVGFLFGWAQLAVILTGSIGIMAFAFADYAVPLFMPLPENATEVQQAEAKLLHQQLAPWLAVGAVVVLTIINLIGKVAGKWTQNLLSFCKVVGLSGILLAGVFSGGDAPISLPDQPHFAGLGFAMILVLYAYGGWNDAAFVAAEVRDTQRNLPRALFLGIGGITLIYVLVNLAYAWGLGFEKLRSSYTPAADLLKLALGPHGARTMSSLVVISALGAINGLIFTGSRVVVSLGQDHRLFSWLGRWNQRRAAPIWALLAQMLVAIGLILAVGTQMGRDRIDQLLTLVQGKLGLKIASMPWDKYYGGFDTLVAGTAPVFWLFFLLTGLALFQLREKDHDRPRPFRVPWYPFIPFIFCLTSVYMLYSSLVYAEYISLLGIVPLLLGLPLYWLSRGKSPRTIQTD